MNTDNVANPDPLDRRERRYLETRDEILREARRLVEEDGASNLSMREVAKNTGFTPPALYRYFPDGKDEVLEALAVDSIELLGEHFRHVPADLPPAEHLLEIAMAYLEFAREHRKELDIMLDSVAAMEARDLDERNLLGPSGVFAAIERALSRSPRTSTFQAVSTEELALIFLHGAWSLVHGMAVLEAVYPHHENLFRTHARELVRVYIKGFIVGEDGAGRPPDRSVETTRGEKS